AWSASSLWSLSRHRRPRSRRSSSACADARPLPPAGRLGTQMSGSTLVRVSLALVATGIVAAASLRPALSDVGPDVPFAVAFLSFIELLLLAAAAEPPRWSPALAFALAALTYAVTVLANGGAVVGIGAYVVAGLAAWRATPPRSRPLAVALFALSIPAIRLIGPDPSARAVPSVLAGASVVLLAGGPAPALA